MIILILCFENSLKYVLKLLLKLLMLFYRDCEAADVPLQESRKFVVFEDNLKELFKMCKVCQLPCKVTTKVCGSMVFIEAVYRDQHTYKWQSQPVINKKPAGNALLCAALCFAGASPEKVLRLLRHAGICVPSVSCYYLYQTIIMQPAINHVRSKCSLCAPMFIDSK